MKKILIVFFALMLALSFTYAQYEENKTFRYIESASTISVVALKYEPFPVEPGEKFKIYLLIKNIGTETARNASCKVISKFPFYVYGQSEKSIGRLASGREWQIDFIIKVDENAIEGTELLEVSCTDDPRKDAWLVEKIPIKIQYRYAIINIVDVKSEPEYIGIGKEGKIILSITNNAENLIQDVMVTLNFNDLPIAPADGISVKKIRNLNKGQIADIAFDIYAMPDADAGFYKVPLTINYTDVSGNKQSFKSFITIKIGDNPKYYVIVDSIAADSFGNGIITLKFVNNGAIDLKYFNVKILETKEIKVKGNQQIYIGDLDADDYVTESFYASIKANKVEIPLEITYKDALGREYKDYINVTLDKSKVINKAKTNYWPIIVILIIIVGLAYYFYKKRKTKSR